MDDQNNSTTSNQPPLTPAQPNVTITTDVNPADEFLEGLIQDAGFDVSLPAVKEELLKDLRSRLDTTMITAALSQLAAEQLDEYNAKLADNASFDEKIAYLEKNIPNLNEVFQQAMIDFYNDFVPQK